MRVSADPPTLNVSWDEPAPPESPTDYEIDATDPDFPNVELKTGSLTWRVWSTDPDNPDGIGDIGVISCPHPQNFAVTLRNDSDPFLRGARDVKGITLVPSSASNQSNIKDVFISGQLTDDVTVQADSFGLGGEVTSLNVSGGS
jgi:hypothetical protein